MSFQLFFFPLSMSQFHDVCYQTCCWKVSSCSFFGRQCETNIYIYNMCVCVCWLCLDFLSQKIDDEHVTYHWTNLINCSNARVLLQSTIISIPFYILIYTSYNMYFQIYPLMQIFVHCKRFLGQIKTAHFGHEAHLGHVQVIPVPSLSLHSCSAKLSP